jgi:hypothetical protein
MLIEAVRLSAAGRRLGFALLSHRDLSEILPRQRRPPGSSNTLRSVKFDALHFKIAINQFVKIDRTGHDIAANQRRGTILQLERATGLIENFERKNVI